MLHVSSLFFVKNHVKEGKDFFWWTFSSFFDGVFSWVVRFLSGPSSLSLLDFLFRVFLRRQPRRVVPRFLPSAR